MTVPAGIPVGITTGRAPCPPRRRSMPVAFGGQRARPHGTAASSRWMRLRCGSGRHRLRGASQQAADILQVPGVTSAVVSLGGNVHVCGAKPDGSAWNVGIQDSHPPAAMLPPGFTDCFRHQAATSATTWRRTALCISTSLTPVPAVPADSDLLSVTVISDDGTAADAYSTALYVMVSRGRVLLAAPTAADLILITDGRLLRHAGAGGYHYCTGGLCL